MTTAAEDSWRRLSARMLLVHPVQELIRALPWLFGLLIAGSSRGNGGEWGLAGLGLAVLAGIMRWFTTSYRITPEQVQLRNGLVRRRLRAVALDRVRTVDVTANLMHRVLGLTRVTVVAVRSSTRRSATSRSRPLISSAPAADAVVTVTLDRPNSCSSGPRSVSTVWMRETGAMRRSWSNQPDCV